MGFDEMFQKIDNLVNKISDSHSIPNNLNNLIIDDSLEQYQKILVELCYKIKEDINWKEKSGFFGNYFENESFNKEKSLRSYENLFESLGFKKSPLIYENELMKIKFQNYNAQSYTLKGITFIYASYKTPIKEEMKKTLGELSKILSPQLKEIKNSLKKIKSSEEIKKEEIKESQPMEIIILKFPAEYMKNSVYSVNNLPEKAF